MRDTEVELWSFYAKSRDRCAGYMWSASRSGRKYVSEKLWTLMLRKDKQKTKTSLRDTIVFYWWRFLILGRFWKVYFCFFFFFLNWNNFNVFFTLWLDRYFSQFHHFFFYFNCLFWFLFCWQENYTLEYTKLNKFFLIFTTDAFLNNLYKYLSSTSSFLCYLFYFLCGSKCQDWLIS